MQHHRPVKRAFQGTYFRESCFPSPCMMWEIPSCSIGSLGTFISGGDRSRGVKWRNISSLVACSLDLDFESISHGILLKESRVIDLLPQYTLHTQKLETNRCRSRHPSLRRAVVSRLLGAASSRIFSGMLWTQGWRCIRRSLKGDSHGFA